MHIRVTCLVAIAALTTSTPLATAEDGASPTRAVIPAIATATSLVDGDAIVPVPDGAIGVTDPVDVPAVEIPLIAVSDPAAGGSPLDAPQQSGCWGRSNHPHESYTQTDYVHAEGTINCNMYMDYLYISGVLTRDRWYGAQRRDDADYAKQGGYKVNLVLKSPCPGTWTWRLNNYHEVGVGGRSGWGNTSNSKRFTC